MKRNFENDRKFGEAGEQKFCERQRGWQRAETKNASFDVVSKTTTAEIKSEKYVTRFVPGQTTTQNICVEVENRRTKKPSGLFHPELQATYWVHRFLCGAEFVFFTKDLREFVESKIKENPAAFRVHYENNAKNYLVPQAAVKHLRLVRIDVGNVATRWVYPSTVNAMTAEIKSKKL